MAATNSRIDSRIDSRINSRSVFPLACAPAATG